MAVPDFQSMMLPLLRFANDGAEHSLIAAREYLAKELSLTRDDLEEVLPSGKQTRFVNRVAWAKVYLQQAEMLVPTRRGHFRISDRGRQVLQNPPKRINIKFLEQYPEFVASRSKKSDPKPPKDETETPEEALEAAHLAMRESLASELLNRVKEGSPRFFEHLVVELLLEMGYGGSGGGNGRAIGRSGDEGIDGIISEDRLGLEVIYLQAKRWDGTVGRPEVQKFVGALHGRRARKGVFITTGSYSADARSYVEHIDPRVVLIDGRRLAELMVDFDVGVSTVRSYQVKHVDSDYFEET